MNLPPQPLAKELVKRAVLLAESDKPWAAITALKKALSISPNYLRAHIEYRNIKANFLDKYDEVEAEYQNLIKRFPNNPVYLMAMYYGSNWELGKEVLQKVAELAPQWAWGHYAKALLVKASDPEAAVGELQHCIEKDRNALEAYKLLIELQEKRLNRIDDAIQTAEKLAAQTDIRANLRLQELWQLRLTKSGQSEEARQTLGNELSQLASSTNEIDELLAIRSAYFNLLKDPEQARAIEHRIVQVDPTWTPQRGWLYTQIKFNQSGVPRYVVLVNRQIAIHEKAQEIINATDSSLEQRIRRLEDLLRLNLIGAMRRIIYEGLFRLAVSSSNADAARKYGKALHFMDPGDSALLAQIALVLADKKKNLTEALYFARKAESLTSEFHLVKRSPNTPQSFLSRVFPEQTQRETYKRNRALALDSLGWVLTQMGEAQKAEALLRRSIEIERSEGRLRHLAKALQKLGRIDDAIAIEREAHRFLADSIRRKLINEKIQDLQLESIEGHSFNLSDLKGRVVMINFWATWCVPCVKEMQSLKRLYEKYKGKGLEILAVSTDDDSSKVRPFVTKNKLNFPVLNIPALRGKLGVEVIPTTFFIDKQGNIRYRTTGFDESHERQFEVVIAELLK